MWSNESMKIRFEEKWKVNTMTRLDRIRVSQTSTVSDISKYNHDNYLQLVQWTFVYDESVKIRRSETCDFVLWSQRRSTRRDGQTMIIFWNNRKQEWLLVDMYRFDERNYVPRWMTRDGDSRIFELMKINQNLGSASNGWTIRKQLLGLEDTERILIWVKVDSVVRKSFQNENFSFFKKPVQ